MKTKKILSSSLAGVLAAAMAMPAGVMASSLGDVGAANDAVIDSTKSGSFTIHKLIENDGKNIISDGHGVKSENVDGMDYATDDKADGTLDVTNPFDSTDTAHFSGTEDYDANQDSVGTTYQEDTTPGNAHGSAVTPGQDGTGTTAADGQIAVTDDSYIPLDGVVFSHKKIAEIVNVSGVKDGVTAVGTYFKLTEDGVKVLGTGHLNDAADRDSIRAKLGVDPAVITVIDGQDYYTTASIEKCLADLNAARSAGANEKNPASITSSNHAPGEVILREYLRSSGTAMPETSKDGISESGKLPLGLYLVGETDVSKHDGLDADGNQYIVTDYELNPEYPVVESEAAPFLVSLPTTNVNTVEHNDPGTVWEYDIDVFPKDQTNSIIKRIIDPDDTHDRALRIREDFQVGDTIEQVIIADAPMLQPYTPYDQVNDQPSRPDDNVLGQNEGDEVASYGIGSNRAMKLHEKFVITDTMSESLTFDEVAGVYIVPKAVNPQYDTDLGLDDAHKLADNMYTVTTTGAAAGVTPEKGSGDHTFVVTLTDQGLKELDKITEDSQVVVVFSSTINKNAALPAGDDAKAVGQGIGNVAFNVNHPNMTWKNSNTVEKSVDGNYVYDYTYELNLTKSGLEDASKAAFLIMRTDDNNRYVNKANRATDGTYLYNDPQGSDKTATEYENSTGTAVQDPQPGASAALPQQAGSTAVVKWVQEAPGVYHVYDPDHDQEADIYKADVQKDDAKATAQNENTDFAVRPAPDGTLILKGFDSDIYTFKELATEKGKNLLKNTFDIEFVEDGDPQFSYVDGEGYGDKLQDGALIRATLTIDEAFAGNAADRQANNLDIDATNKGVAKLTVDNYKAVTLRTGGEGRTMLYMGGAALLGLLSVAVIADKKRKTVR